MDAILVKCLSDRLLTSQGDGDGSWGTDCAWQNEGDFFFSAVVRSNKGMARRRWERLGRLAVYLRSKEMRSPDPVSPKTQKAQQWRGNCVATSSK